ncbi:hypothetical protein ACFV6X_21900, partial [Streptomyces sp. NPDC059861]
IDPMTYIAKGAGAGLSKIGDISAALKGVGNIEIPRLPDNAITLPEGSIRLPEGAVRLPEGATIPPGGVKIPEGGAVTLPEGTALPAGAVDLGNGAVKLPEGTAVPPGAVELPEGAVKLPDDAPVLPEGTVKLPTDDGAPARYYDPEGNILDEGGNVVAKADDGPGDVVDQPGIPRDGADLPRVDSPVREPAMAGAVHAADNAGQHIRLGSDVGDLGRIGDNLPGSTADNLSGSTADNLPGGRADNLPTNSVDNLPGGHADDLGRNPSASQEPPSGTRSSATPHDGPPPPHDGPTPPHDNATPPNGHADDGVRHDPGPGSPGGDGVPANHGEHQPEVPRTEETPEGIRVEDDNPLPPPGAGDKNFGTLPEHRLTVDPETQLITHVDGRPVGAWLDDLSRERGAAYREAKEAQTFSRKEAGECVGAVVDLRTGQIFEGINGRSNNVIPVDQLHPTLADRFGSIGDPPPHKDHPLGHAEVKAANQLLRERTKRGLPDGPEALTELRASVEFPFMKHKETGLPGRPAPFCANCNHMLEGVPSTHGRYTGFPPSDENWIP